MFTKFSGSRSYLGTMNTKPLKATPVIGLPRRTRTAVAGRTCTHPDCNTILSVYNKSQFCYTHTRLRRPRTPR